MKRSQKLQIQCFYKQTVTISNERLYYGIRLNHKILTWVSPRDEFIMTLADQKYGGQNNLVVSKKNVDTRLA